MAERMITTSDNPFNPFTQFREWEVYDRAHGYHTLDYLARVVITSENLSEADQELAYDQAAEEIVEQNINGLYVLIEKPGDS